MRREGGIPPEKEKEIRRETERLRRKSEKLFAGLETAGRELQEQAIRDSLTGLLTRHAFEEEARRIAAQLLPAKGSTRREGLHHLTVMLLDIDHFKRINDAYGHAAGDKTLKAVAEKLSDKKFLRAGDVVARWGGEEFAFAFPGADADTILQKFGRDPKVEKPARYEIPVEVEDAAGEKHSLTVTVSGGVTEYQHGEELKDALARADKALYFSKEHGRDQIVSDADVPKETN